MAHVYKHERGITLTLLGMLCVLLVFVIVSLLLEGLTDTFAWILFATAVLAFVLLLVFMWICMKKRITLDFEQGFIILEYVRYPVHFFDVLPKRRVEVPIDQVACLRPGLLRNKVIQLSWHVYTKDSRFDFTAYMRNERRLREQLDEICLSNRIPEIDCRLLRGGWSFDRVLLFALACVLLVAIGYAVMIFAF